MKRERKIITVRSAAEYLAVSKSTIYRMYKYGKLEGLPVMNSIRLYEDSVKDYEEKNYCC